MRVPLPATPEVFASPTTLTPPPARTVVGEAGSLGAAGGAALTRAGQREGVRRGEEGGASHYSPTARKLPPVPPEDPRSPCITTTRGAAKPHKLQTSSHDRTVGPRPPAPAHARRHGRSKARG
jgi:hypothetical protein